MRMRNGSTSGFWKNYNRQQDALAGKCMPRLQDTMAAAETYPAKKTDDRSSLQSSALSAMIADRQNIRRVWSF